MDLRVFYQNKIQSVIIACFILAFCQFDTDVCIYSKCAFLTVKWILMLIMYNAASS